MARIPLMLRLLLVILSKAITQERTSTNRYIYGHEATGAFKHVAGSACCHPQIDPWPVIQPEACETRCMQNSKCDAFIFAPKEQLCFLIRYSDRQGGVEDGLPLDTPSRPAADRIFGVIAPGSREARSSKSRTNKGKKRKKQTGRRTGSSGSESNFFKAFGAGTGGFEYVFGDADVFREFGSSFGGLGEDCEVCGEAAEFTFSHDCQCDDCECAHGISLEELLGKAQSAGMHANGRAKKQQKKQWREWFSQNGTYEDEHDGFEEQCFADFNFTDVEACSVKASEEWKTKFWKARGRIWPDSETCMKECTSECHADIRQTKAEAEIYVKKLMSELLGAEALEEAMIFEMGFGEDEEEVLCSDTCNDVCSSLSDDSGLVPSGSTHPGSFNNSTNSPGQKPDSSGATAIGALGQDADAGVRYVASILRDALKNAGERLAEEAAPHLLDGAPLELPFADSGSSLHASLLDAPPSAGMLPISDVSFPPFARQAPQSLTPTLPLADFTPSKASLFQGLPRAARWAKGSPPFLESLLGKAMRRLGPAAWGLSWPSGA